MVKREKPSARRVPISRVRCETMAYMVFIAPKTAPMPITIPTKAARIFKHRAEIAGLVFVVFALRFGLHLHLRIGAQVLVEGADARPGWSSARSATRIRRCGSPPDRVRCSRPTSRSRTSCRRR